MSIEALSEEERSQLKWGDSHAPGEKALRIIDAQAAALARAEAAERHEQYAHDETAQWKAKCEAAERERDGALADSLIDAVDRKRAESEAAALRQEKVLLEDQVAVAQGMKNDAQAEAATLRAERDAANKQAEIQAGSLRVACAEVERLRAGLTRIADSTAWNSKETAEFLLKQCAADAENRADVAVLAWRKAESEAAALRADLQVTLDDLNRKIDLLGEARAEVERHQKHIDAQLNIIEAHAKRNREAESRLAAATELLARAESVAMAVLKARKGPRRELHDNADVLATDIRAFITNAPAASTRTASYPGDWSDLPLANDLKTTLAAPTCTDHGRAVLEAIAEEFRDVGDAPAFDDRWGDVAFRVREIVEREGHKCR